MRNNEIERLDELLRDVNGQIAKSQKTREAIEKPGSCTSVVENAAKLAEQRARGEDETGIF